jgi:hypothetical protein
MLKWQGHNKDRCLLHMVKVNTRAECHLLRVLKEAFQDRVINRCLTSCLKCKDKVQWELQLASPCTVKDLNPAQF